jgi:hypothetical protein
MGGGERAIEFMRSVAILINVILQDHPDFNRFGLRPLVCFGWCSATGSRSKARACLTGKRS